MRTCIIRITMAVALVLFGLGPAAAQETGAIMGTVTDVETGVPLEGTRVLLQGQRQETFTNSAGRFLFPGVTPGEVTVEVQRLGYGSAEEAVTVTAGSTETVNFELQPQAVALDALVVTGYGEQRREDITGSVASVGYEEFVEVPARDAATLIAGKIPGLNVTTPRGDPRSGTEISLRGITTINAPTDPLVIIDGVPGDLETVAPMDIESIDVLKGGSAAAVYGSRASNGVIFITTRKHQAGREPTIRYHGYASAQSLYKQPDFLDADDYRRLIDQGWDFVDHGSTTDWQDQVLRTPVSQTHNLTIAGGGATTHYTASLSYEDNQGIVQRSSQQETTARVNIGHTMFDGKLRADVNALARTEESIEGINYDYTWRQALIRNPTDEVYADDGTYQLRGIYFYPNPVGLINEYNGDEEDRTLRVHGTMTYSPIDALSLSAMAGTEKWSTLYGMANTQLAVESGLDNYTYANRSTAAREDRILELTGTFQETFGGHDVTLLGGYSYQDFVYENFRAGNQEFPTDLFGYNSLESGDALSDGRASMNSGKSSYKVIGFFSRLNYDFNNRFLSARRPSWRASRSTT